MKGKFNVIIIIITQKKDVYIYFKTFICQINFNITKRENIIVLFIIASIL